MITQQGLEQSLYALLEYGYKCCESGDNIQKAREGAAPYIAELVKLSGLKREVLRIKSQGAK